MPSIIDSNRDRQCRAQRFRQIRGGHLWAEMILPLPVYPPAWGHATPWVWKVEAAGGGKGVPQKSDWALLFQPKAHNGD